MRRLRVFGLTEVVQKPLSERVSRACRFYELKGTYETKGRRLFLEPIRGKIGEAWEPCDAEAYVSHDYSTMSGISLCEGHGSCDPGGGEFVLRHDRTQFVVEGAGDPRVNGQYSSQPRFPISKDDKDNQKLTRSGKTQMYDGAPIYLQACPKDNPNCETFAIVHEVIGQFGFWRIIPSSVLTKPSESNAAMPQTDHAIYSVCSEDVYPPDNGWRPLKGIESAPAPAVRATVRSTYTDLQNHARLRAEPHRCDPDSSAYSTILLGMIGLLLWVLFLLALRSGIRFKSTKKSHASPSAGAAPDV